MHVLCFCLSGDFFAKKTALQTVAVRKPSAFPKKFMTGVSNRMAIMKEQ